VLNSDPEGPDIIEISPGTLPRNRRKSIAVISLAVLAAAATVTAVLVAVRPAAPAARINPALARLITDVTTVPEKTEGSVYLGYVSSVAQPVTGTPLRQRGKPEVFYVYAGYCPYCAAQNWALIVALSHFGTFSGLSTVRTHLYDGIPPIDGWTFYGAAFTSKYLAFVPTETRSGTLVSAGANPDDRTSYRELQMLTPAQLAVFDKYDPTRAVPFIDFGNRTVRTGSIVAPSALVGQTWSQIASTLRAGDTAADRAILGAAGSLTAQLCQLTNNRPASACSPGITFSPAGN
jgi:Domain of unknown function (DUF929)